MAPTVSRDEAREIAREYLRNTSDPVPSNTIRKVLGWDEISFRRPTVYGFDEEFWKRQWVVYLDQPTIAIRSSFILTVDRSTGEVTYVGSAHDEG